MRAAPFLLISLLASSLSSCARGGNPFRTDASVDASADASSDTSTGDDGGCKDDLECDDAIRCTVDTCNLATGVCSNRQENSLCSTEQMCTDRGCVNLPQCSGDESCDDGNPCNGEERCEPEVGCVEGTPLDCDDGNGCTTDVCDPVSGACMHLGSDADGDGRTSSTCGGDDCDDTNPAVFTGATELCDGADNDCSGTEDDTFACVQSMSESCSTTCGTTGMRTCADDCSGFSACTAMEACNGCDDDGDGESDETFSCVQGQATPCDTACGTRGSRTCDGDCVLSECVAAEETCDNGCDDDGDDAVDEGCVSAPANDLCTGAVTLSGLRGTQSAIMEDATSSVEGCGSGRDIWFRINVPRRALLYVDNFGTTFDSRISLWNSCGGTVVQCEDDDCGERQEKLMRVVNPGNYFIAVHTFGSSTTVTGPVQIRWQILDVGNGEYSAITRDGTYSGTLSGSGTISPECTSRGLGPEAGRYFFLCPGDTESVTAATCDSSTGLDTVLSIRGGNNASLACNDDSCGLRSSVTESLSGPGAFVLEVDGYNSDDTGAYVMTVSGL